LQIFDIKYPLYSTIGMIKTLAKIVLDIFGHKKYNYFKNNKLINISTMTDGQKIYEFVRFNNYYKGAAKGDSFEELNYSISRKVLDRLKKVEGYSIVYVHLGKNFNLNSKNGKKTTSALNNLKQECENGNIYVDTTIEILNYYVHTKYLKWYTRETNGCCNIIIQAIDDPVFGSYVPTLENLKNITFYMNNKVKLFIENREIKNVKYNPPDQTGRKSVTILNLK